MVRNERFGRVQFMPHSVHNDPGRGQCGSVEEMHEQAIEMAREALVKCAQEGRDFVPVAMVFSPLAVDTPRLSVLLIAEGWSDGGKREIGRSLAEFARVHQAAAIVLATDGWAILTPEGMGESATDRWIRQQPRPSEHPDRKESLTVNLIYPDATCVGYVQMYERRKAPDGHGEVIAWGQLSDSRKEPDNKTEQALIPAWTPGGMV